MLHIDDSAARPAQQARGGAAAVPGNRLRAALPGPRRAERDLPGDARASTTRRRGTELSRALRRLPAARAGRGPDARRRDDRRQGRPLASARTQQANPDTYVHIVERSAKGIVISRHQGDRHRRALHARVAGHARAATWRAEDADFAVCCAVPVDAPGITIVARPGGPAGREARARRALFARKYGQSTGVVHVRPACSCRGSACSTPANGSTRAR